jgi:hypothetical protein
MTDHNSKVSPDWVAPPPEHLKPVVKVSACLGCGKLPHTDEIQCLRSKIRALTLLLNMNLEERAKTAYAVFTESLFGILPTIQGKDGRPPGTSHMSGHFSQTSPMDWSQLPDIFKEKWRKVVRSIP